jgi:hypothetical protein
MEPRKTLKTLCDFLEKDPPHGAEVKATPGAAGDGWFTQPKGPAYAAAERALKKGFNRDPVYIGCGGSIPFVEPLTNTLEIPALLMGSKIPTPIPTGK